MAFLSVTNYESPTDKAMRLYIENKRALAQKRADMEKEAFNLAFSDWIGALSADQKSQLLPETIRGLKNETAKMATLQQHFKDEIWPNEIKAITE